METLQKNPNDLPKKIKISKGALKKLFAYAELCRFDRSGRYNYTTGNIYEIWTYPVHNMNRGGTFDVINDILIPPGQFATESTIEILDHDAESKFLRELPEKDCFILGWAHSHGSHSTLRHTETVDEPNLRGILLSMDNLGKKSRGLTTFNYPDTVVSDIPPHKVNIRLQAGEQTEDWTLEDAVDMLKRTNYLYRHLSTLNEKVAAESEKNYWVTIDYLNNAMGQYRQKIEQIDAVRTAIIRNAKKFKNMLEDPVFRGELLKSKYFSDNKIKFDFNYKTGVKNAKESILSNVLIYKNCENIMAQFKMHIEKSGENSYAGITLKEKLPELDNIRNSIDVGVKNDFSLNSAANKIKNDIIDYFYKTIDSVSTQKIIEDSIALLEKTTDDNPFKGGFLAPSWETYAYSIIVNASGKMKGYVISVKSNFSAQKPALSEIVETEIEVVDDIENDVELNREELMAEIKEKVKVRTDEFASQIKKRAALIGFNARFMSGGQDAG